MRHGNHSFIHHGLGVVQNGSFVVYYIVLCHGRHRIHHGMSIRREMVTLRMDLCYFAFGKPRARQHKSIPLVTIFLLIGSAWRILYIYQDCQYSVMQHPDANIKFRDTFEFQSAKGHVSYYDWYLKYKEWQWFLLFLTNWNRKKFLASKTMTLGYKEPQTNNYKGK